MGDLRISNPAITSQSLNQAKGDLATQNLRHGVAQNDPSRIDKAARDFESILIGQWLEQAEKSFGTVPGTDPDQETDSAHDQFQSIACQTLAQGLSKTGGFGIASMISKQLLKAQAHGASSQGLDVKGPGNAQNTK
ncbi:MAG TPA: rod-binding protein [Terriglobales bacterium]|nr:rod-binding protein [Terriglobales bacterium]HXY14396.1 rod-binding protein [Terriglobales bacterium]